MPLALALATGGCPALLHDDFEIVTIADASTVDAPAAADAGADGAADAPSDTGADAGDAATCSPACSGGRSCTAGRCTPAWVPTADPGAAISGRQKAAACAISGGRVFVWGGATQTTELDTGAIYDPATDAWTAVPAGANTPSARVGATAVWTGSQVVVWGGGDLAETTDYANGGRFDPAAGTWQTIATGGGPGPRRSAFGVWTGSSVLVYGGAKRGGGAPSNGAFLYDPTADAWTSAAGGAPAGVSAPAIAWSGTDLYVLGGLAGALDQNTVKKLTASSGVWSTLPTGPSARHGAFAEIDGTYLVAWSGATGATLLPNGGRLALAQGTWDTTTPTANGALGARQVVPGESGWSARVAPNVVLFVGGEGALAGASFDKDGALYDSSTDEWTAVPSWPSGADHARGIGVWTGTELVIWGGTNAGAVVATGERLLPRSLVP